MRYERPVVERHALVAEMLTAISLYCDGDICKIP